VATQRADVYAAQLALVTAGVYLVAVQHAGERVGHFLSASVSPAAPSAAATMVTGAGVQVRLLPFRHPSSRRFNPSGHRMHLGCSRYMRRNPTRPNPGPPSASTA
jgi:hypothetical protein